MTASGSFSGSLLLAMPGMQDPRFERAVICICSHDEAGAMGLVVNKIQPDIDFTSLLEQLGIDAGEDVPDIPIHSGGPVEPGRGFILHTSDFVQESTLVITERLALTATVDILEAIAFGEGPEDYYLALGYAGWGAGQLEAEIQANAWLTAMAEEEIIFHSELEQKWSRALAMIGVDAGKLSISSGHA